MGADFFVASVKKKAKVRIPGRLNLEVGVQLSKFIAESLMTDFHTFQLLSLLSKLLRIPRQIHFCLSFSPEYVIIIKYQLSSL